MTDAETRLNRASLERVVRQIVEGFHPQRIILFGSCAYGEPTQDSGVDLLVVPETRSAPLKLPLKSQERLTTPSRWTSSCAHRRSLRPRSSASRCSLPKC